MKNLLAVVLVATLLFTGCGEKPAITAEAKEYGYFNFENLEWGMTPAEVMKKLGKKESDFKIEQRNPLLNHTTEVKYILEDGEYKERKARITYAFYGIADVVEKQSLRSVKITFSDTISREEAKEINASVQSDIQAYEIETIDKTTIFYPGALLRCASKTRTSDLPQETQDKANAYARKLVRDLEEADEGFYMPSSVDRYRFTLSENPHLSQVVALFDIDEENTERFGVYFDGQGMAYTKLYARLAEAEGVK